MAHAVTLIPGDGIGPELTEATRRVLEATGVGFVWDVQPAGAEVMGEHGGNPAAGLIGGLGVAPGANFGRDVAVFEPTHGSAPKYAGQNKVNPIAQLLSGVLMLRHLDEADAADRLERAIADLIQEGRSVTYDMKPTRDDPTAVGTSAVADALIEKLTGTL